VQLAIEQVNATGGVAIAGKTYKVEMFALDDRFDPVIGATNAEKFVADPAVLAVVGPYSSRVSIGAMPVFNRAGLAHISPSNTYPALTEPRYGQLGKLRPTGRLTYFRNVTPEDIPGPAAADYIYNKLGAGKVYVIRDNNGEELADNMARRFREIGGAVLGPETLQGDAPDFERIVKKVAASKPEALLCVCRGDYAATTRKQMVKVGLNIPFMIAPNVFTDFITDAGADAEGSYAVNFNVDLTPFPRAQQFHADYKKRFGEGQLGDPELPYYALAYDATNLIVQAMERAEAPDRELVRQQIAATRDFQGITGSTGFDENGDRTTRWVPLYQVKDGAWIFIDQLDYQGTLP
jgi:branched-chain amino acid transport system substrate-binding protein